MPASQRGLIKHRSISTLTPWIIARDDIKLLNKMSAGGFGQASAPARARLQPGEHPKLRRR